MTDFFTKAAKMEVAGALHEALALYQKALLLAPESAVILNNIGNCYRKQNQFRLAQENLIKAIAFDPNLPDAHNNLGLVLNQQGRFQQAKSETEAALNLAPNTISYMNNLANILVSLGHLEDARRCYTDILKIAPDTVEAHIGHAKVHKFAQGDTYFTALINQAKRPELTSQQKHHILFALGKAQEDLGNFDIAFKVFQAANDIFKKNYAFNSVHQTHKIQEVIECYPAPHQISELDHQPLTPVFVLGVSRSGKSLVERLLDQSTVTYSLDEDMSLFHVLKKMFVSQKIQSQFPLGAPQLTGENYRDLADQYSAELWEMSCGASHFIHTAPAFYKLVGLIFQTFPNAKVIYCLRDPMDIFIETYFYNYEHGNHYARDLDWIKQHFINYNSMMSHWERQYGDRIHTVKYEQLVQSPDNIIPELFAFCGIEFPQNIAQISLNTDRVDRWKNYEKQLKDLRIFHD